MDTKRISFINGPLKRLEQFKRGSIVKSYLSTYFVVESIRLETDSRYPGGEYILLRSFSLIGPIEYIDFQINEVILCPSLDYMRLKKLWGNKLNSLEKGLNYKVKRIIPFMERVDNETKSN